MVNIEDGSSGQKPGVGVGGPTNNSVMNSVVIQNDALAVPSAVKLNGSNYHLWSKVLEMHIAGRGTVERVLLAFNTAHHTGGDMGRKPETGDVGGGASIRTSPSAVYCKDEQCVVIAKNSEQVQQVSAVSKQATAEENNQHKLNKVTALIIYVDDMIVTRDTFDEILRLQINLVVEFEMKNLGNLKYFMGVEVACLSRGIFLSQRKYVLDLLKETSMLGCKPVDIPIVEKHHLGIYPDHVLVDKGRYQRLVRRLIYLAQTRPDIAYAVSVVSQFMHSPSADYMAAVKRILAYLKFAPGKRILYRRHRHLRIEGFTDAYWVGDVTDRRSTSGYFTFFGSNLVTWCSKKQKVVARSSAEAEYKGMAQGICEILWLRKLLWGLGFKPKDTMKLYCDDKSAKDTMDNPVKHDTTKHMEVDTHFVKEKLERKIVSLLFVTSNEQLADVPEAEYRGMAQGICEILWLRKLLWGLGFKPKDTMKLYCDNKSARDTADNPVQHDTTKHVEVDTHFVKEKLERKIVSLPFVTSKEQLADVLTHEVRTSSHLELLMPCAVLTHASDDFELRVGKRFQRSPHKLNLHKGTKPGGFLCWSSEMANCSAKLDNAIVLARAGEDFKLLECLMPCAVLARAGEDFKLLEQLMPYAVLACAGEDFEPLEHLMPCAVLARTDKDFEPLGLLMPYVVLVRAGEDFEPLELNTTSCHLRFDAALCHLTTSVIKGNLIHGVSFTNLKW
ncbi:hypothetical protein D8674_023938 [Pyrus ussuriensis x Pyrus communis]|uniref:Reverse transcriptase Ty1/copia-type domain-containing protein n=1 Tax=Pyrus ussuriensis x Pyrus communis TaxID=2448454 RepID=A0A5N5H1K3_9ROSA|nr:hypothetical protein D8674_023938 [Pyrus ussuriensis x Pyrus communis]